MENTGEYVRFFYPANSPFFPAVFDGIPGQSGRYLPPDWPETRRVQFPNSAGKNHRFCPVFDPALVFSFSGMMFVENLVIYLYSKIMYVHFKLENGRSGYMQRDIGLGQEQGYINGRRPLAVQCGAGKVRIRGIA